jgi:phosphonatase-like hydrolase
MKWELAVFDMAGTTLYDGDAVNTCFRAALAGAGVSVDPAQVNTVMGLHKPEAIRILLLSAGRDFTDSDVDRIHADFVARMKQYYKHDPAVRELPGASASFAKLRKAGIKIALNTGFNREIVDVILARLNWRDAVDATVASDEVARGRPFPDMIRHLLALLDLADSTRVVKIGDTLVDLEEGKNARCGLVFGVTTGAYTRAELEQGPHDRIVDSLAEAVALILENAEHG